jgi:N-acetylneuraminic acid mutarotase
MLVWGGVAEFGEGQENIVTGGLLDPATRIWTRISSVGAPTPRTGYVAVWTGTRLLVWGGRVGIHHTIGSTETVLATGAQYDLATDTWAPLSGTGAPAARYGHTAVWTGSRLVVWGGIVNPATQTSVNTGGRLANLSLYVKQ